MSQVIEVLLDDKGHLSIPADAQKRLGLLPGMRLIVESGEEGRIQLRIQTAEPTVVEKDGLLVVKTAPIPNLDDVTQRERTRRLDELGRSRI